jgi:predicted MPP superfamily phosphohydrolase
VFTVISDYILTRRDFLKIMFKSASGSLGLGLGIYGYGHEIETRWLEIRHVTLTLPRLTPAFDGYRIVQISDIHKDYWMPDKQLAHIVAEVNKQDPDLVVNTGDFVSFLRTSTTAVIDELVAELKNIQARDGVLAVLGNHDYWTGPEMVRDALRRCHTLELPNDVHTLRRGDEVLHFAGLEDIWAHRDRLDLVLERLPADGPAILLWHNPEKAEEAAATGRFDVQLSGHTHGGQISIPLVGRPWRKYSAGRYQVGSMILYVNRGLGIMFPYVRLGSRPEITVLTLKTPLTGVS